MKKQARALVEIGIIYLAISIVLDFLLRGYPNLLWSALGLAFVLFGIMIFAELWELTSRTAEIRRQRISPSNDELKRLEQLCESAIDQGDVAAGNLLSKRLKSLAFAAAAFHLNESEATLRTMAMQQPSSLHSRVGDEEIFRALVTTGPVTGRGDWLSLQEYLSKIEEWTK